MAMQHRHRVARVAVLIAAALVLVAAPAAGNRDIPERGYALGIEATAPEDPSAAHR